LTLQRWDVLNTLLGATERKRYLEIGVQSGMCGGRVSAAAERWGVDPEPRPNAARSYTSFHRMTSDAFFEQLDPAQRFDVVFVDGLHHADQVLRDVDHALGHLAPGGYIVLHDCNPLSEAAQAVPRRVGVWNGDCWKALVRLRARADLDAFVIDADHGLGVVRRGRNRSPLFAPRTLEYSYLEHNRRRALALAAPEEWEERVGPPLGLGRVVVVSANFGGRDSVAPVPQGLDVDECVLFSDSSECPDGWNWGRHGAIGHESARQAARRVKTRALELERVSELEPAIVVWIDGRITLTGAPIRPMLRAALSSTDVASYPHPWRQCAYDEATECAALELAPRAALEQQIAEYEAAGFPSRMGLWNTMVVARRCTDAMRAFGADWHRETTAHTVRDQVSFPYLLWKHGITCGSLGRDVYRTGSSAQFQRGAHAT
jgi:hypothetical protein